MQQKLCVWEVPRLLQVSWYTSCSIFIIQLSKQWPGENMYKICQNNKEKICETNAGIYMALLQMRLTSISPGLPSQATLLFHRAARGILPKCSRPSVLCNDENKHVALVNRQAHAYVDIDSCKNIPFLHTGSTVVVQHDDGGPWMHGTIVGHRHTANSVNW